MCDERHVTPPRNAASRLPIICYSAFPAPGMSVSPTSINNDFSGRAQSCASMQTNVPLDLSRASSPWTEASMRPGCRALLLQLNGQPLGDQDAASSSSRSPRPPFTHLPTPAGDLIHQTAADRRSLASISRLGLSVTTRSDTKVPVRHEPEIAIEMVSLRRRLPPQSHSSPSASSRPRPAGPETVGSRHRPLRLECMQWAQDPDSSTWVFSVPNALVPCLDAFLRSQETRFRHFRIRIPVETREMTFYATEPPTSQRDECAELDRILKQWCSRRQGSSPLSLLYRSQTQRDSPVLPTTVVQSAPWAAEGPLASEPLATPSRSSRLMTVQASTPLQTTPRSVPPNSAAQVMAGPDRARAAPVGSADGVFRRPRDNAIVIESSAVQHGLIQDLNRVGDENDINNPNIPTENADNDQEPLATSRSHKRVRLSRDFGVADSPSALEDAQDLEDIGTTLIDTGEWVDQARSLSELEQCWAPWMTG